MDCAIAPLRCAFRKIPAGPPSALMHAPGFSHGAVISWRGEEMLPKLLRDQDE
ncbi:hypothetical protein [uncultured Ruegeria sp.]|uniref:hypothetical protein n=1 Tax=uncultured Ruegeria sp. TaxID=259304 RepID=UPI00262A4BFB|nr:hypothetical protein [uncultured Ruegeria sp.]